jgi:hypothetical protein
MEQYPNNLTATDAPDEARQDRRGGRRAGAGRPPSDPVKRAQYDAAKGDRRTERRGGYRPNAGRRRGDKARETESAAQMASRHVQELATIVARHRREMRAWVTRNKQQAAKEAEHEAA